MKQNKRNLKIQFRHEKQIHSLSAIEMPTKELEKADVMELLNDGLTAPVVVHLLNSQCHITYSSKAAERILKEEFCVKSPEEAEDELKELQLYSIDFLEEIKLHARRLAEKQVKSIKPDKVIELIREKWETSDKKEAFLQRLGLPLSLVSSSAKEVEAAYMESLNSVDNWL